MKTNKRKVKKIIKEFVCTHCSNYNCKKYSLLELDWCNYCNHYIHEANYGKIDFSLCKTCRDYNQMFPTRLCFLVREGHFCMYQPTIYDKIKNVRLV